MNDAQLLALHRDIVAIRSVSHTEGHLCDWLEAWIRNHGIATERLGNCLFAAVGEGPILCLNTHIDTVPPSDAWTKAPWDPTSQAGKVYGLGANDAKASVAAMLAAFVRLHERGAALGAKVLLTLVPEEETGGKGTEVLLPELQRRGLKPEAVIVGEPTSLDIAVAQKGLLILELCAQGRACHAAHGHALGAPNAVRLLARDLVAIESLDFGAPHPDLGPVTLEPTVIRGGTARNVIPAEATCILDVRTNPNPTQQQTVALVRAAVKGEVRVISDRLRPFAVDSDQPVVRAALKARPSARLIGSRGLSDLAFFEGTPGIKVGPGATERSHTPDEFVLESEILEGARFYEAAAVAFGELSVKVKA